MKTEIDPRLKEYITKVLNGLVDRDWIVRDDAADGMPDDPMDCAFARQMIEHSSLILQNYKAYRIAELEAALAALKG